MKILDDILGQVTDELEKKPDIELLSKNIMGVFAGYLVRVTFFKGEINEISDEYDISEYIERIMYMLSLVETESTYIGNDKSARELYIEFKPKIRKYGKVINELGGVWLMYGVLQIIYSLNKNYYELVDECWKNIGLWK